MRAAFIAATLILTFALSCLGQDDLVLVQTRLVMYYGQMNDVQSRIAGASQSYIESLGREITAIDAKWNAVYQPHQAEIAAQDTLLQMVANYQVLKQQVSDSVQVRRTELESLAAFDQAEAFIMAQDTAYANMYKKANELSLVKALSSKLETLQAKEQQIAAQMDEEYAKAKAAAGKFDNLTQRFTVLEARYLELKTSSEKIQELKYVPLLQRIKDYIYSLAAVAMIVMFISTVQSKIQAARQAKENARKFAEQFGGDKEYPEI